ncbi:MAG: hypothetical protein SNJ82_12095 [Gemmataceae bacterium]
MVGLTLLGPTVRSQHAPTGTHTLANLLAPVAALASDKAKNPVKLDGLFNTGVAKFIVA